MNTYGYVRGNPTTQYDPDGRFIFVAAFGWGAATAMADMAVAGAATWWWQNQVLPNQNGTNGGPLARPDPVEARGNYHPTLPHVKPGRDCNGNCNPCPPGQAPWREANHGANSHGSPTGFHWHKIVYNQVEKDPDCKCIPQKLDSPDGIKWK